MSISSKRAGPAADWRNSIWSRRPVGTRRGPAMLADAFAAELYKLLRNRSTWFWGFCAAPLGVLLFNLALDTYIKEHMHVLPGLDMGRQIVTALGLAGSSFVQIFFAAGAAAIFAGEYRWESWRLLTPRNSRVNLMAAKFLVYMLFCVFSLL